MLLGEKIELWGVFTKWKQANMRKTQYVIFYVKLDLVLLFSQVKNHFQILEIWIQNIFCQIKYCETQPPASIGWVALSSVIVCLFGDISSHLPFMMFLSIQTIYFCEDMILATCQSQHIFCCWVKPSLLLSSLLYLSMWHHWGKFPTLFGSTESTMKHYWKHPLVWNDNLISFVIPNMLL